MKHTPGPWKVNNVFIENEPNRFIVSQNKWGGNNIADCGLSGDGSWDVNEANAHLIAAAPEMLEALKGVLDVFDDRCGDGCTNECCMCKVRALISKLDKGAV